MALMPLNSISSSGIAPAETGDPLLEYETVAAMLTYQHYLGVAQRRFDRLCRLSKLVPESSWRLARANAAYSSAAAKLDRQDIRLAKLLERLGYIPKVDRNAFQ